MKKSTTPLIYGVGLTLYEILDVRKQPWVLWRDLNKFDEAIRLLTSAVERFDPQVDYTYLAESLLHLGWTEWFRAEVYNAAAEDIRDLKWNLGRLEAARRWIKRAWKLLTSIKSSLFFLVSIISWPVSIGILDAQRMTSR